MRNNIKMDSRKVVFILGEQRSGTTWLSFVLGSHSSAIHLGEYYRPFTIPNHVSCRLCEAKGKIECEFLHGIENIDKENAHDFAFNRFQKSILVDCSKEIDWLEIVAKSNTFQIKIIHLHRDPRAWFISEKKRNPQLTSHTAIERWIDTNKKINETIYKLSLSSSVAYYDELSTNPNYYFPRTVNSYLEIPFEEESLDYWRIEHHGLSGNGAALNNLIKHPNKKILTSDDNYYEENLQKRFHDIRWLKEITLNDRHIIENNSSINEYLYLHNRSFTHLDDLIKIHNQPKIL